MDEPVGRRPAIDDTFTIAPWLCAQRRHGRHAELPRAKDVDLEDLAPHVDARCLEVAMRDDPRRAGVVDEHVETTEVLEHCRDESLAVRRSSRCPPESSASPASRSRGVRRPRRCRSELKTTVSPQLGESPRRREADAARRSRDEDDPAHGTRRAVATSRPSAGPAQGPRRPCRCAARPAGRSSARSRPTCVAGPSRGGPRCTPGDRGSFDRRSTPPRRPGRPRGTRRRARSRRARGRCRSRRVRGRSRTFAWRSRAVASEGQDLTGRATGARSPRRRSVAGISSSAPSMVGVVTAT